MLALTSDFHGESRKARDIHNTLKRIAGAGFTHVHWCHEWTGLYLYSDHEMHQIREWYDEEGLLAKGIHATAGDKNSDIKDYGSQNNYNRLAGVDLIKNRVDLACILNAGDIVLHMKFPNDIYANEGEYRERYLKFVIRSLDELEPYCKTRHIRICLENLSGAPEGCCRVFDTLFERYDKDFLGLCLDTGHALIHCKTNCLEYAERYNDRLFMIHLHDNHGESDEHLIPFDGNFNWEGFARVLARSPCGFPLLIESQNKTEMDDTLWLEKTFNAGSRFLKMVSQYR